MYSYLDQVLFFLKGFWITFLSLVLLSKFTGNSNVSFSLLSAFQLTLDGLLFLQLVSKTCSLFYLALFLLVRAFSCLSRGYALVFLFLFFCQRIEKEAGILLGRLFLNLLDRDSVNFQLLLKLYALFSFVSFIHIHK